MEGQEEEGKEREQGNRLTDLQTCISTGLLGADFY